MEKVTRIYAILHEDEEGNEGIVAIDSFALISASEKTINQMLELVPEFKKMTDMKLKVVCFNHKASEEYL